MKLKNLLALSAALVIVAGCGGGGGGGSSTNGGGGASNVRLFATDDMSTAYDHVWVNIKQVSLTGASGDQTLFSEATGRLIDLKTLRDSAGRRFDLLSNRAVSSGHFTGLKVVVDSSLSVFPTGSTTATQATFDGAAGDSMTLSLNFASPRELHGGSNLIVDFDLSRWTLNGNVVSATGGQFLNIVEDSRVDDPTRHELDDYKGTISNASGTAPAQTFTLNQGNTTLQVTTDANTSIYNEDGTPSPALTNGERVEVTGSFSTAANTLVATTIKIDNQNDQELDEVKGQITDVSAANGTVTISLMGGDGFEPTTTTLTLSVNDATKFFSNRGVTLTKDEFFAQATINGFIEAEGTLDGSVFTPTRVKLEDEVGHNDGNHGGGGDHGGAAELTGTPSNPSVDAGTFTLSVTEWEGLLLSNGAQVTVAVSNNTEFKVNGSDSNKADFFTALATATSVSVEGAYNADTKTITASEIKIGEDGHGGGGGGGGNDDGGNHR